LEELVALLWPVLSAETETLEESGADALVEPTKNLSVDSKRDVVAESLVRN
jgi:hypothetical protein